MGALFPKLENLLIRADGTRRPSTSFFDIGNDLGTLKEISAVALVQVGSVIAEYDSEGLEPSPKRFTIRVEYKALLEAWGHFSDSTLEDYPHGPTALDRKVVDAWNMCQNMDDETSPYHYAAKERFRWEAADFFEVMIRNCRSFWRPWMWQAYSFEFWTNWVPPYERYNV